MKQQKMIRMKKLESNSMSVRFAISEPGWLFEIRFHVEQE